MTRIARSPALRPFLVPSLILRVMFAVCILAIVWPAAVQAQMMDSLSKVSVSARVSPKKVKPGSNAVIAVVMDHAADWHSWTNPGNNPPGTAVFNDAIRTELKPATASQGSLIIHDKHIQWPPTYSATADIGDGPKKYAVFSGKAVIYLPITIKPDAGPGPVKVDLLISFQSCDDETCMAPVEDHPISAAIEIDSAATESLSKSEPFASFDASVFDKISPPRGGSAPLTPVQPDNSGLTVSTTTTPPGQNTSANPAPALPSGPRPDFFGIELPRLDGPFGIILLIIFSMAGGFILNLTPCVLPIIPLKIMAISQHAHTPGKSLALGIWMAAGVVAFWAGIGIPAALFTSWADPSRLFGIWWLTLGIGVLIAAMGVGIMGLFNIQLPQSVYAINPKADSPGGSFLFGIMTAVLGLPCFGFVAGALLAGAATLPPTVIMLIFTGMGVGMAAPYLVLSAKPSLVQRIPRTGPASELVKQVMGLLLLAAAAYFIGSGMIALVLDEPYIAKQLHWWVAVIFACAAAAWLMVRTFQISRKPGPRIGFTLLAVLVCSASISFAIGRTEKARAEWITSASSESAGGFVTGAWNNWTPERFEAARQAGHVVVLDFTADWCLTCQALKAAVLDPEPVKSALAKKDVVVFKVDLTSRKAGAAGWKFLADLGQTGIPTLAIYGPGASEPSWIANAYTAEQVITAIDSARTNTASAKR